MKTTKNYDQEFKIQAIKLAKEIGNKAAADELGIPISTIGTWVYKAKQGDIDVGSESRSVEDALNIVEQLQKARKRIKELEKENRELERTNEILKEATVFFAASRQKSVKKKD